MIFEKEYSVKWHDTDAQGEVRPSRILEYMQETSTAQFLALGHPLTEMHENDHMGFILSRIAISFDRPLRAYETIQAETFATGSRGIAFGRYFRIRSGSNGETVARARSLWALVRTDTNEMVKVTDCPVELGDEPTPELSTPLRFRIPADALLVEVGEHTVRYSDLDFNLHMNNTRYPDMLADHLPELNSARVTEMSLSFLQEAAEGETVRILRAVDPEVPGRYWFRTVRRDGKTNVEAMVMMTDR